MPILIIMASVLATGFTAAALLPMVAGAFFSSGGFVATSDRCKRIQADPDAKGWLKVLTNPAVHWNIGYAALGLVAGGGL